MRASAKLLRARSTDAERLLWHYLRARHLAGFKFRRQLVIEPYIVDFACIERRLIVEVDGGQHAEQRKRDEQRAAYLKDRGYRVLRFWNHEILTETHSVLDAIYQELIDSPSSSSSSEEERG